MSLMVGSARIDENGKISGGKPGDQAGNEVSTQPYYVHSKGWICMRPKSVAVANAIAEAMIQACKNNNIRHFYILLVLPFFHRYFWSVNFR